jgi:hypothetical protein
MATDLTSGPAKSSCLKVRVRLRRLPRLALGPLRPLLQLYLHPLRRLPRRQRLHRRRPVVRPAAPRRLSRRQWRARKRRVRHPARLLVKVPCQVTSLVPRQVPDLVTLRASEQVPRLAPFHLFLRALLPHRHLLLIRLRTQPLLHLRLRALDRPLLRLCFRALFHLKPRH